MRFLALALFVALAITVNGNNITILEDTIAEDPRNYSISLEAADDSVVFKLVLPEGSTLTPKFELPAAFQKIDDFTYNATGGNLSQPKGMCWTADGSSTKNTTLCNFQVTGANSVEWIMSVKVDGKKVEEARIIPAVNYTDEKKTSISVKAYHQAWGNSWKTKFKIASEDKCSQAVNESLNADQSWFFEITTDGAPLLSHMPTKPKEYQVVTLCAQNTIAGVGKVNKDLPESFWKETKDAPKTYCVAQGFSCDDAKLPLDNTTKCGFAVIFADQDLSVMNFVPSDQQIVCNANRKPAPKGGPWLLVTLLALVAVGVVGGIGFALYRRAQNRKDGENYLLQAA